MRMDSIQAKSKPVHSHLRLWLFPAIVLVIYLILLAVAPDRAWIGVKAAANVIRQAILPLCLAFGMMLVLNRFITPDHVSRFLGGGMGIIGIFLSAAAGVISMGPVFAWYPFLESLRKKGASDFHLANFLSHRAVKPALLPMMILYFGWRFSLVFTIFCSLSALITATVVGLTAPKR